VKWKIIYKIEDNMKNDKNISHNGNQSYNGLWLPKSTIVLALALKLLLPSDPTLAQSQVRDFSYSTNSPKVKDTCDCEPKNKKSNDCGPKYIELNFLRKPGVTFSSKEVWTLDKGKGVDILALDCKSTLENVLELVDFKDEAIKKDIISGHYNTIEDHTGRMFAEIHTKRGMRYFTVQNRDQKNPYVVNIDGRIDYSMLKNHGNKTLSLDIEMGQRTGFDKFGKPFIRLVDSGIIPLSYCDDCMTAPPIPPIIEQKPAAPLPAKTDTGRDTVYIATKDRAERVHHKKDVLIANVSVGLVNNATQLHEYECGPLDIDSKPDKWKISTYAEFLEALHLNAELTGTHANVRFLDPGHNPIGQYGMTATDFLLDARGEMVPFKGAASGIGAGMIFEENSITQKGRINSSSLNGNSNRYSGLAGIVFFVDDKSMSNLSLGAYLGRSSELGNLMNATIRLDNLHIGRFLSLDSHIFFENYKGNFGNGNRVGFEVLAAGPQIMGFLSPFVEYEITDTRYPYDNGDLAPGSQNSVLVGLRMNLSK